jgi:hypothetical protein
MLPCVSSGRQRLAVSSGGYLHLAQGLAAICLSLSVCYAQHQHVHVQPAGNLPAGTIDGSVSPQLITDAVAYRLFFNAACEQPQSANEDARQRAMLARAHLSDAELTTVSGILTDYRQQMNALEQAWSAATAGGHTPNAATQNFPAQRDEIVTATKAALAARLSAQGLIKLDQVIQSEKRHMKVVPYPNMP